MCAHLDLEHQTWRSPDLCTPVFNLGLAVIFCDTKELVLTTGGLPGEVCPFGKLVCSPDDLSVP